jgi:endonuclease/exonuclease/phosphatase (EEP) superfamily protein YafD
MITFLFWNVGAAPRQAQIARLAVNFDADVVLLAEVADEPINLLQALNKESVAYSYAPGIGNTKIHVFARFSNEFVAPVFETDRLTVRRLALPGIEEVLLAVVHFPSKLHWSDDSQAMECSRLAVDLQEEERKVGHQRTVLVGDFNMNPFETGVVSAGGLHAVMSRAVAKRESRIVQGRAYSFFYNPMWSVLGDGTPGPPGTFYYHGGEQKVFFWNMLDQVLIRPALLDRFRIDDLAIIDHTGEQSLLTDSGLPNRAAGSDHLPILFRLSL